MAAPTYSILIPYQPDGGVRDLIAQWTVARWQAICPEAEVITAGDDSNGPLLNRSRMRNNCAKLARTDTLLFVDADAAIYSGREFEAVRELLAQPGTGMVQYQSVTWLTMRETATLQRHSPAAPLRLPEAAPSPDYVLLGLFFAITRAAFEKAGRFDERMTGWGEEDPAFRHAVQTLAGPIIRVPYTMYHLWHPRTAEHCTSSPAFLANKALCDRYRAADGKPAEMRRVIAKDKPIRAAAPEKPLRILGVSNGYPPALLAGAEITLHSLLRSLQANGATVAALALDTEHTAASVDGIPVCHDREQMPFAPEVIIGSHGANTAAVALAKRNGIPVYCLVHNDMDPAGTQRLRDAGAEIVANSDWLAAALATDLVQHPIVIPSDYQVAKPGKAVTLVNLAENKGAGLFWEIAARMPKQRFLAVRGAYDDQIIPDPLPPNVTLTGPTADMRAVYEQTRVLLIPSEYESYGRVAIEAALSGIPVIANATDGLVEALGDAGIYRNRSNAASWVAEINRLGANTDYRKMISDRLRDRAAAVTAASLDEARALLDHMTAAAR